VIGIFQFEFALVTLTSKI